MTTAAALLTLNLIAVAEAAALPCVSGFEGDDRNVVAFQAGFDAAVLGGLAALRLGREQIHSYSIASMKYHGDSLSGTHFHLRNNHLEPPEYSETVSELMASVQEAGYAKDMSRAREWMLLLGVGLFVLQAVESLNGFGSPNFGDTFTVGAAEFGHNISDILQSAFPNSAHWSGKSANDYRAQNKLQHDRVAKLADADHRIAGLLRQQAAEVEQARTTLAGIRLGLVAGLLVCGALYTLLESYATGYVWSMVSCIGDSLACAAKLCFYGAIPAAIAVVSNVVNAGVRHGNRISDAARDGYQAVIDDLT